MTNVIIQLIHKLATFSFYAAEAKWVTSIVKEHELNNIILNMCKSHYKPNHIFISKNSSVLINLQIRDLTLWSFSQNQAETFNNIIRPCQQIFKL